MDQDPLPNFAVPVQAIQFATFSNPNAGSAQNGQSAPVVSAYADPTESSLNMQNGTSPAQRRSQSVTAKNPDGNPSASRSPQSTRKTVQTRASQSQTQQPASTPSRNASVATTVSNPQSEEYPITQTPQHLLTQPSTSQSLYNNLSSAGSSLVWKNSTSAFPNGTPRQAPKQAPVYTTPQGLIHSDPWSARHNDRHNTPGSTGNNPGDEEAAVAANPFSDTFPLMTNPPNLEEWRNKLFNVHDTLVLSEEEYLTYFPHVDNVYSHRSTQKYKRKPFVSHYWDCRLKGRPSGTPKSDDPNKKKRKRQARERDLCDVKIKVTEYYSVEEARKQGLVQAGPNEMQPLYNGNINPELLGEAGAALSSLQNSGIGEESELTIIQEDGSNNPTNPISDQSYGLLELPPRYPKGHPGAEGKRWFTIQRVRGNPGGGAVSELKRAERLANGGSDVNESAMDEEGDSTMLDPSLGVDLDHKHTLEESDRIKKNTVQRWILKEEKERKRLSKITSTAPPTTSSTSNTTTAIPPKSTESQSPTFRASGMAFFTARSHASPAPSKITFFANSFCPFAQRVWIALEIKGIPYQMVEVMPPHLENYNPPEMLEVNPEASIPCIRHGNWGVWESGVIMEYLEDLAMGHNLLPLGNPQLRAHCRLWTDHINRKILPSFYSLLLTPPPSPQSQLDGVDDELESQNRSNTEQHTMLVSTLQKNITSLVNASHATGPYFLGSEIGYVDVVFAPWIIRLSRVLSYYRNFPRPEIGTRWRQWVDAIESDERVRRTVSDENSYHGVYRGVGEDGWDSLRGVGSGGDGGRAAAMKKAIVEIAYAKRVVAQEGFGLGGDVWGHLGVQEDDVVNGMTSA